MQTDTTPAKFAGYYAIHTDKTGTRRVVRVINEGMANGGTTPALKVRRLNYRGCVGWSGGCRAVHGLGESHWVLTSNVTGSWKSEKAALRAL